MTTHTLIRNAGSLPSAVATTSSCPAALASNFYLVPYHSVMRISVDKDASQSDDEVNL